jgi:hypothetical protein
VRSTDNGLPHYKVFCTPLLPRPSKTQIFSPTPCSQTLSSYAPPSMSVTKFHTHTNGCRNANPHKFNGHFILENVWTCSRKYISI